MCYFKRYAKINILLEFHIIDIPHFFRLVETKLNIFAKQYIINNNTVLKKILCAHSILNLFINFAQRK